MRAIISRIRRLETAAVPAERERAAVEAINEARRRHLDSNYKPSERTPESVAGSGAGDAHIVRAILRARIAWREYEATHPEKEIVTEEPRRTRT